MRKNWESKNRFKSYVKWGIIVLFAALLIVFVFIRPFSIQGKMDRVLLEPSSQNVLGTDSLGRDVRSCIIYGAGVSLSIGLIAVVLSATIGGVLGMAAGISGGIPDMVIMRITDVFLAFPGILLAIGAASVLDAGYWNLIFLLGLTGWAGFARIIRGEVLKLKQKEFILAARCYNASWVWIIIHHIVPLVFPMWIVQSVVGIPRVILTESSLNFLGIGLDPFMPTLGEAISSSRDYMFDKPWLVIAPGVMLFLIIWGINLVSLKVTGAKRDVI